MRLLRFFAYTSIKTSPTVLVRLTAHSRPAHAANPASARPLSGERGRLDDGGLWVSHVLVRCTEYSLVHPNTEKSKAPSSIYQLYIYIHFYGKYTSNDLCMLIHHSSFLFGDIARLVMADCILDAQHHYRARICKIVPETGIRQAKSTL